MVKKILKKILPNFLFEKLRSFICYLRSFLYFKGFIGGKPQVFCVMLNGKRLFLSSTIDVSHWSKLNIGNNVFIWHFTVLDTFNGVVIGDNCQIGTRVGIFTHSSHNSIRIYNSEYHDVYFDSHHGRRRGSVEIGSNTFVGANSIIMPGTKIGKGCIVSAFSYVNGSFEDFSIISGNPAKKIGDTRGVDFKLLKKHPELIENYVAAFGAKSLEEIMSGYINE